MAKSVFTSDYRSLRELLIHARQSIGLTQFELAKKLGRPQSFVSKYERGERRLDVIEFIEIAHVVGIDATTFIRKAQKELTNRKPSRN